MSHLRLTKTWQSRYKPLFSFRRQACNFQKSQESETATKKEEEAGKQARKTEQQN
jgi:hypothetical protein